MIDHLWQSTVFALVAAAAAWWLRNERAAVRCWLWAAASAKFLLPLSAFSSVGTWLAELAGVPRLAGVPAMAMLSTFVSPAGADARGSGLSALLLALWMCGAGIVCLLWARQSRQIAGIIRQGTMLVDGHVVDTLRRLERSVGYGRPVPVIATAGLLEPTIAGAFRPVLLWPVTLEGHLSERETESVVAHEFAHIRRRDNLLASLHALVNAVWWFHPMVWWIGSRLIHERERACDEQVLELGNSPAVYAAGLLRTCAVCVASPAAHAAGITGGDLMDRITWIMRHRVRRPLGNGAKSIMTAGALAVFVLPITWGALTGGVTAQQAARAPQAARAQSRIVQPRLRKEVKPEYPQRAKDAKIQGEVILSCIVQTDGHPTDIKVIKSLEPELDRAAVRALEQWEFYPGTRDDKPVPVQVNITMEFTLK